MKLFCTLLTIAVLAFLGALVIPVDAEKYRWEGYPWPSYAGKPSREKPMRRELSERLEFGEMYPESPNKAPNVVSKPQKRAKSGHKPAKSGHKATKTRPRGAAPPPLPERNPLPDVPEMENPEPAPDPLQEVTPDSVPVIEADEPWTFLDFAAAVAWAIIITVVVVFMVSS